jgi:hypothetical protein
VTVAPFLFIAGTDSKHYTTIADSILRFMPIRMTAQDITLPHNANERIGLHAFKYVQKQACYHVVNGSHLADSLDRDAIIFFAHFIASV